MAQIARQTVWPTKESLTMPTLNNEFNNIVNTWNNHDSGASTFGKISALDITFPNVQGVWRGFNVKDYGAKGDTTTDDTTAIQNAINAAQNAFGGCVVFPTGSYKITSALTITKSVALIGCSGSVGGPDTTYTTNAGAPNLYTMGVIIWQSGINNHGITIQQSPTNTYAIRVIMQNLTLAGQTDISGVGPGGTSGDGIHVDAGSVGQNIQCFFDSVSIEFFRGYGLKLVEGYFSSTFRNMNISGNSLSGFYAIGTSQGEYTCHNLRCFGNGSQGATEADASGVYCQSGGQGISFIRLSCTSNYKVQTYIKGSGVVILDYQAESFNANNSSDRSLVVDTCQIIASGMYFSPQSTFLGKIIDLRSCVNSIFNGIHFNTSVDPTGFHIYEDGSSGSNSFQATTVSGTFVSNLSSTSTYGNGNSVNQVVLNNVGAARSQSVLVATPATSSRTWTVPDISGNATFASREAAETLSGQKTLSAAAGNPIHGTNTNDSASAGYIGEYIESVVGFTNAPASGNIGDLTSITLTAGDWEVTANVFWLRNSATYTSVDLEIAITSTSGNSGTGIVNGSNMAEFNPGASALLTWSDIPLCVPSYRVSISGSVTYYLKFYPGGYSAGTPQAAGRLSARRFR